MAKLQTLRRNFETISKKHEESILYYFSCVSIHYNQMSMDGENISKGKIVEKILRSLPPKFDYAVVEVNESNNLSTFSQNVEGHG